jgi:hypothetical protein
VGQEKEEEQRRLERCYEISARVHLRLETQQEGRFLPE